MLGDLEQDVDQLVAVLDAQQATTLQVTRKVNLIKQLASLLNQVCLQSRDVVWYASCMVSSMMHACADDNLGALESVQPLQVPGVMHRSIMSRQVFVSDHEVVETR